MEKQTKIKIIVFSFIALLFLGVLAAFVSVKKKRGDKKEEVSEAVVHSQVESSFTVKEMMEMNQPKPNQIRPVYGATGLQEDLGIYQEEDEAVLIMQQKIIERKNAEDSVLNSYRANLQRTVDDINKSQPPVTQSEKKEILQPTLQDPLPRDLSVENAEVKRTIEGILNMEPAPKKSRFYKPQDQGKVKNTVLATVHGEQTVHSGSTIKLRLLEAMNTKQGTYIPEGSYVFGIVKISGERMDISVKSIQMDDVIIPIHKSVYDMDGIPGIKVPGNLKAEIATELTESALNEMRGSSYSGNVLDQGVNALTRAGQRALRKQNRIVRVTVKSNYKLYLKDEA